MPVNCVIFDCDGTLVETEEPESVVFADMLVAQGYDITARQVMQRFRGMRKDTVLAKVSMELGRQLDSESFIATWRQRSQAVFETELQLVPGARELVSAMQTPFCIASNGPPAKMALTLRVTGLAEFFGDRVYSAYEIDSWKPDPGLFMHAARAMNAEPTTCLVVEDSKPGVVAGLAAGMTVLAYQPDSTEAPLDERATVIRHLSEVTNYL